ncbi:histone H1.1, embryonic-like [Eurosta solidaginis]|uniref:histone H1.1, embryonic-like n=1 Tax=Eurosta solidaginis TaxID=178769 RepID=UPI003530704B
MYWESIIPNAHSTLMEFLKHGAHSNTQKLPTTQVMVDEAIHELNSSRGFSLQKLKKYINEKYHIEITSRRYALIKEQLRLQITDGILINVTGRGLSGCLKLQSKAKLKKASLTKVYHTMNIVNEEKVRKRKKSANKATAKSDMIFTATPSTPTNDQHQPRMMPLAPHRSSVADLSQLEFAEGTPCSSGGGEKTSRRRLFRIASSQVF